MAVLVVVLLRLVLVALATLLQPHHHKETMAGLEQLRLRQRQVVAAAVLVV